MSLISGLCIPGFRDMATHTGQAVVRFCRRIPSALRAITGVGNTDQRICTICLYAIRNSELTMGHDMHQFHAHCLQQWFQVQPTCPNCRQLFPDAAEQLPLTSHDPVTTQRVNPDGETQRFAEILISLREATGAAVPRLRENDDSASNALADAVYEEERAGTQSDDDGAHVAPTEEPPLEGAATRVGAREMHIADLARGAFRLGMAAFRRLRALGSVVVRNLPRPIEL